MDFSTGEIDLLKQSLAAINADPRRAAAVFYDNLFRALPEARDLFVADMTRQGEKLMATLNVMIPQIGTWSVIDAQIEELGLRHVAYGVQPEHYAPTGQALRDMMAEVLGPAYTPEHDAAWAKAFNAIADGMVTALERRKSRQPSDAPNERDG